MKNIFVIVSFFFTTSFQAVHKITLNPFSIDQLQHVIDAYAQNPQPLTIYIDHIGSSTTESYISWSGAWKGCKALAGVVLCVAGAIVCVINMAYGAARSLQGFSFRNPYHLQKVFKQAQKYRILFAFYRSLHTALVRCSIRHHFLYDEKNEMIIEQCLGHMHAHVW